MRECWARSALAAAASSTLGCAHAETMTAASGAVTGQIFTVLLGMGVVLALIAAAAWLMKRLAPRGFGTSGALRVVAGAAVGQRERVVVVEIDSTWLVVGVAPGSVNFLHQMPRVAQSETRAVPSAAPGPFALWLKQRLEKRGER